MTDEEYEIIKKFAVELSHFADLKSQLKYYAAENDKLKARVKELESKIKLERWAFQRVAIWR